MSRIDLNCDLGEGSEHDAELMTIITSANIACGGHAGDEATMRAALALAIEHGVAAGAHPGLVDRGDFGRTEHDLTANEVRELVLGQTRRFQRLAVEMGIRVRHVKPHGALYNRAARDGVWARAVADAVFEADPALVLVGLAGSRLPEAGRERGLRVMREGFADRSYQADGSLTPRGRPDALIHDRAVAIEQVLRMVRERRVRAVDGSEFDLVADTVCVHGDGPDPAGYARGLRSALSEAGVIIGACE